MTTSEIRWQELQATFSVELDERVAELNRLLLQLEKQAGSGSAAETIDALFREAHSLKGAARAVQLQDVEQLAHALESALDELRRRGAAPAAPWFDAAYRTVDAFQSRYHSALNGGNGNGPNDITALIAALSDAAAPSELTTDPVAIAPAPVISSPAEDRAIAGSNEVESVRVKVAKLDALLAQSGELSVTNIRVAQRLQELQIVQRELSRLRREWRAHRLLAEQARRALDQIGPAAALPREVSSLLDFLTRTDEERATVLREVEEIAGRLRQDSDQLRFVSKAIEDEVMAVRLLPVATIFNPFERMVRDLARDHSKEVRLALEGTDTEIDRKILEQLRDPLMHMLRNAVDHGLETADRRRAAGKPATGSIRLAASQRGGEIQIELEDDGAGIDPATIRTTAVRKGLLTVEQAAALDDQAALELIFQPGFSTAGAVSETSGRGVGMDVVREHVERLNGHMTIDTMPGKGTRFTIGVPLTLATTRVVLVEHNGQIFAVPSAMVEYNARVRESELVSLEGRRVVVHDCVPVPVAELGDILEQPHNIAEGEDRWRPFFILWQGESRLAVLADRLIGEQEIVVKNLGWPLRRVRNVGGAAVLGSGETVLILNPSDMLKSGLKLTGVPSSAARLDPGPAASERRPRRVLVADDSLTTRTLEKTILEAAGYDTVAVSDGMAALDVLRNQPIDLVVSDVEMPRLDGFGLTAEIRRDEKLQQLPVILVTSLEAREHHERGLQAGADAYIAKSGFDQGQLLDTVARLL